jgi:dephospho-CoA kinase
LTTKHSYRCIFVVGLQCAGKTTFLEIAHDSGFGVAEWSDIFRQGLQTDQIDRAIMFDNIGQLVALKGIDYYPNLMYDRLCQSGRNEHVVSGARNPNELKYFRSLYQKSKVLWISTNYMARFQRAAVLGRGDQNGDLRSFLKNDFHELAGGLAHIASEQADDILFNDSDYSDYRRSVMEYLESLSQEGDE